MGEILIKAEAAVAQLAQLRTHDINLRQVASGYTPDHAHWKNVTLPTGQEFDTKLDLLSWFHTWGAGYYFGSRLLLIMGLAETIVIDKKLLDLRPRRLSAAAFTQYFKHHGIEADIAVSGTGLFDYRTGARVTSNPTLPPWDADGTVKLLPEVDYKIDFCVPGAAEESNTWLATYSGIGLNTTKVDGARYRPNLIGYPAVYTNNEKTRAKQIKGGEAYLARLDTWLRRAGLEKGITGLYINLPSVRVLETFQEAAIPRINPQTSQD